MSSSACSLTLHFMAIGEISSFALQNEMQNPRNSARAECVAASNKLRLLPRFAAGLGGSCVATTGRYQGSEARERGQTHLAKCLEQDTDTDRPLLALRLAEDVPTLEKHGENALKALFLLSWIW
ncbi:hypothetical protein CLAIMM_05272 isoform 4 [Cladophialophora immunda]|nr:hypothetical protein CLAIMM_05272 isoform 2 [Cladophialophora immunda]OQU99671.1 hypothetical protein CLAIMM_05272 isoform 4 [Cladophialophora immunda]